MVPYLPPELLRAILSSLSIPSDLARCCLTSKTFLSIAQPLLYRDIRFDISENAVFDSSGILTTHILIEQASRVLLTTLRRTPHLRQLIQHVEILGVVGALVGLDEYKTHKVDLEELVKEIVGSFPSTRLVTLDNVSLLADVDEAVHSLQSQRNDDEKHRAPVPAFSLVVPGLLGVRKRYRGAYERFQWIPFSTVGQQIDVEARLGHSLRTLRQLEIPLDNPTSLSLFHHLERLSLRLSVRTPSSTVQSISATIDNLSSLQILILHGTAREEDLQLLLQSGLLARSLPPALTQLSLAFRLIAEDFFSFLRDLPTTSNLKRFNCLSETEEMEGVVEVFAKRGIRLSFDEDWDIQW